MNPIYQYSQRLKLACELLDLAIFLEPMKNSAEVQAKILGYAITPNVLNALPDALAVMAIGILTGKQGVEK